MAIDRVALTLDLGYLNFLDVPILTLTHAISEEDDVLWRVTIAMPLSKPLVVPEGTLQNPQDGRMFDKMTIAHHHHVL